MRTRTSSLWGFVCVVSVVVTASDAVSLADLDRYGGYTGLKGHNSSGFFRVEQIGGRFWLITPDNHAFLSIAVTTANFFDHWGGFCPPLNSYPTPYSNRARYNGENGAWETALKANLARWGFNGLGCWCQAGVPDLTENVRCLHISEIAYRLGVAKIGRNFPDVFDPLFAEAADKQARSLAKNKDDPYRIGAFPDNEIGWVGADYWGRSGGPPLPDGFIQLSGKAPGKRYWALEFLRNRYKTITALNHAYGASFVDFEGEGNTLINATGIRNDTEHPAVFADKLDFVEAIADRYYHVVTSAMRQYDPNHLVFSARWALWTTAFHKEFTEYQAYNERIWKKAGQYADIMAINSYMDNAALERDHHLYSRVFALTGKPFLITEWAAFADDTQFARHKEWFRYQHQRGEFYFEQMKTLFDFRFEHSELGTMGPCLGAQWFQYYDEPALGRRDGERNNYGLLNVKGEAYQTALDVMRTFNVQAYDYVVDGRPLSLLAAPTLRSPLAGEIPDSQPAGTQSARPHFEWSAVRGATSYTLLYSPEKCFPEGQTVRVENITSTRYVPQVPLFPGLWYCCVRAVDAIGLGGRYCDPIAFRVEESQSATDPGRYLDMEDPGAWHNVSLDDGRGNGVVWAWLDGERKQSGRYASRVVFTVNSLNTVTGRKNDCTNKVVWRYEGPPIPCSRGSHFICDFMPDRAVDNKGNMTISSAFMFLRVRDTESQMLVDARLDPDGKMEPHHWRRVAVPLEADQDCRIASLELYVDSAIEEIPWDQRLTVWMDNISIKRVGQDRVSTSQVSPN